MRVLRVVLLVVTLLVGGAVTANAQPATEALDQAVNPTLPVSSGTVIGGSSQQILVQVFTPSLTGPLTRLRLHLSRVSGSNDPLIVEIRPVNTTTWAPESTILAQQIVPASTVPIGLPNANWVDVVFAQPADVTARTPYAIVVRVAPGSTAIYNWSSSSEVYRRGFASHGFLVNGVESFRDFSRPPFGDESRPFETYVTTSAPRLIELTTPVCVLAATGTDAQGNKFIDVKVQDVESGLARIKVVHAGNLFLNTNDTQDVNPPIFTHRTTDPVIVRAIKLDPTRGSRLILEALDADGNVTTCDPVDLLVMRETGAPVTHTLEGIPAAEGVVTVTNQTPGVKTLDIVVNGTRFKLTGLKDGETRTIDIAPALHPGDDNIISLAAHGPKNSSVYVLVWDGLTG